MASAMELENVTENEGGRLTKRQIVRLAAAISADKIGSVAEGYLDMEPETVKNLKSENVGDTEAFHRGIIRHWANKHPENQIQILASILHTAAREHSYVDPHKVQQILGVSAGNITSLDTNTNVTREEFLSLAEELKPYIARATKLHVVPWIKDYEADMKDLYSDLILEQEMEKNTKEVKTKTLNGYSELFEDNIDVKQENQPTGLPSTSQSRFDAEQGDEQSGLDYASDRQKVDQHIHVTEESSHKLLRYLHKIDPYVNALYYLFSSFYYPDNMIYGNPISRILKALCENTNQKETRVKEIDNNDITKGENGDHKQLCKNEPKQIDKTKKKKVLIRADPGFGKTTLMKRIGWDWARGVFTKFAIVFIIFLKLVNPGDTIENVIIDQTPGLEGMNITPEKIKYILENFGNQLLLIFDGLVEHRLGQNKDVLKIIQGKKLLHCNVIVTSRPHSTKEIERYFDTVGRIEGFSRKNAAKFAFCIVQDERKVENVLKFNPAEFRRDTPLYTCPILLSFMCLLVSEDDIDLSSETISTGEIYFRMIRCLYKKFTIRKKIQFQNDKFIDVLWKVGKLALQTLLSGNSLLTRSDVISDIGEEAFEYGLLIGHEDFRLIRDETADIYVMFPHRSILEFLGAFYFILMFSEGETLESILGDDCKEPIFMINPLFFQFCLWFSHQKYVTLHNIENVLKTMKSYISARINVEQVHLYVIGRVYTTLDLTRSLKQEERKFLGDILGTLDKMKHLVLQKDHPIDFILTSMRPVLKNLESVTLWRIMSDPDPIVDPIGCVGDFNIVLKDELFTEHLDLILKHFSDRHPSVYLHCFDAKLSKLMHGNLQKLHIKCKIISCEEEIMSCPFLTHLSVSVISDCVLSALSKAVHDGKLPRLTHLGFDDEKKFLFNRHEGKMHLLFKSPWRTLTHLRLTAFNLTTTDIEVLDQSPKHKSNITEGSSGPLFEHEWTNMKSLSILNVNAKCIENLNRVYKPGTFPQLTQLELSLKCCGETIESLPNVETLTIKKFRCSLVNLSRTLPLSSLNKLDISGSSGITGTLSKLLCHGFPSLNTLILSDCGLNSQDLCRLAQASVEGRLPELRHLDISDNRGCAGHLESLFGVNCKWAKLVNLNITYLGIIKCDIEVLCSKVASGCLGSLQELSLLGYSATYFNTNTSLRWPNLRKLNLLGVVDTPDVLLPLVKLVEKGSFPDLQSKNVRFKAQPSDVNFIYKLQ